MAQLPPVLVWGEAVLVELELEVDPDDVVDEVELSEDDDPLLVFDDVAAVALFVLDVLLSPQAIAPPNDRAVATLRTATARRARWARGLRRSTVIGDSSGGGFSIWTDGTDAG
jgi:hypothetical protein